MTTFEIAGPFFSEWMLEQVDPETYTAHKHKPQKTSTKVCNVNQSLRSWLENHIHRLAKDLKTQTS